MGGNPVDWWVSPGGVAGVPIRRGGPKEWAALLDRGYTFFRSDSDWMDDDGNIHHGEDSVDAEGNAYTRDWIDPDGRKHYVTVAESRSPQKRKDRKEDLEYMKVLYKSPNRTATAKQAENALGWKSWRVVNVKKRLKPRDLLSEGKGGYENTGSQLTKKGITFLEEAGEIDPKQPPSPF